MIQAAAIAPKLEQDDFYNHLFRRFLLPEAAAALLGFSAKHVIRLAREGALRGFNLAVKIEDQEAAMEDNEPRSMVRIQARSVEMLRSPELFARVRLESLELADDLLHRRDSFSVYEMTMTFDCSDNHVRRLLGAGLVQGRTLSEVSPRQHVRRESLLDFLRARELTAL